ncbi:LysR family transcriptional regulator [Rhodococcus wratislaviensis]|uniref:LysR family transcriptional regulator n=1 Tax=Rhodococcus wratislaviensis TaxID=44752 RepID=A0AB38FJK7_RHOWR|nr:hypothetical protein [Rhodococcus wratislaviensis]SPZ41775.1 LysR family transcriptional regulator [Rhodococcus wratislaviensis]
MSDKFSRMADVKTFELPFSVPAMETSLYTLKKVLPDPGTEWFRATVRKALGAATNRDPDVVTAR